VPMESTTATGINNALLIRMVLLIVREMDRITSARRRQCARTNPIHRNGNDP
jgi:hypothetical protein